VSEKDTQAVIVSLVRTHEPANQSALQQLLRSKGVELTQSSLSRHLNRCNIRKIDGRYKIPGIAVGESRKVEYLQITSAGDNMLVIKTPIGGAARAAYLIDAANIPGLAGTISGDDTIFAAISEKGFAGTITKQIVELFTS
jgi:transcriptional regulator of arginine metabolism